MHQFGSVYNKQQMNFKWIYISSHLFNKIADENPNASIVVGVTKDWWEKIQQEAAEINFNKTFVMCQSSVYLSTSRNLSI